MYTSSRSVFFPVWLTGKNYLTGVAFSHSYSTSHFHDIMDYNASYVFSLVYINYSQSLDR